MENVGLVDLGQCGGPPAGLFTAAGNEEMPISLDQFKGNWKRVKGKAQEEWGKLSDDDMKIIEDEWAQPIGRIQDR